MTWDGHIIYVTEKGHLGIVKRDLSEEVASMSLPVKKEGTKAEISNSIAVGEDGGIYIVSNDYMQKIEWDGKELNLKWKTEYDNGGNLHIAGRLGTGSGTTPSIMGDKEQGRFVVIGDGAAKMNIVFFDCETGELVDAVPVDFGKDLETSMTEQSILVNGWRALVTSNDYDPESSVPPSLSGDAPKGLHQFEFDVIKRKAKTTWTNNEISIPNGITTMSAATGLIYGIGKRDSNSLIRDRDADEFTGMWTLEALDWWTGESKWYKKAGAQFRYNSLYAATEVGGPGEIITGTSLGVLRFYDTDMMVAQQKSGVFTGITALEGEK
jgi:hypothetical protein